MAQGDHTETVLDLAMACTRTHLRRTAETYNRFLNRLMHTVDPYVFIRSGCPAYRTFCSSGYAENGSPLMPGIALLEGNGKRNMASCLLT